MSAVESIFCTGYRGCKFWCGKRTWDRKRKGQRKIQKFVQRCKVLYKADQSKKGNKTNQKAYYGEFGGQYVAESLMNTLEELDKAFEEAIHDPEFMKQYYYYLKQYVGRETPLLFCRTSQ